MNDFLRTIIKPPYRNLPWLALGYVIACVLILHHGGVFTGHLIGFDDHVRMTEILNWINGAGWYDRTMMRANPPEGFTSIWARIDEIPFAVIIIIAQKFMPQKIAALVAAAIVPLIEIVLLFAAAAPYFARPLVGKNKARLIVLFLIFTSLLNTKYFSYSGFVVGQVSHHPWYVILNLLMFGATARLAMGSARFSPILMLGGSIALLFSVGIESFPLIAGAAGLLALVAWSGGRPAVVARGGDGFLLGAMGALLLLPAQQPPEQWMTISFAEPSILGVILILAAGVFLKFEREILLRLNARKAAAAAILCAAAALIGAGLVCAFPDILNGGAAGLSPIEREMALHVHFEALSIYGASRDSMEFIGLAAPIFLALAAGIFSALRAKGRRRATAICYLGFAALGGGMSFVYSRYYHHAMTTACAWLLWTWEKIKDHLRKDQYFNWLALAIFIALGPFWMLLLPEIDSGAPIIPNVLLFPASVQAAPVIGDPIPLSDFINAHYNKNTLLVVNHPESANFLYYSDVRIDFIDNYPSHNKFIDNFNLFATHDPKFAEEIVARHNVDLIAVCTYHRELEPVISDGALNFYALLQTEHAPHWLRKIDVGNVTNYLLYEVDKKAVARDLGTAG
ncbi:MAG: hypothetical protein P4M13_11590 [Alphaproteobacteria bacterium]|nr:hypothetical protein [Alphaproteobacteria bacterium]